MNNEREYSKVPLNERIEAQPNKIIRYTANEELNSYVQEIASSNSVMQMILDYYSQYPFRQLNLTCTRSAEGKNLFLQIIGAIKFGQLLPDLIKEIMKVGEVILVFEGGWTQPKFLDPNSVWVSSIPVNYDEIEEHIEYQVDDNIRNLVFNTPRAERSSLMNVLDPYSIRQIELGKPIDLTRSPYVSVVHLKRQTEKRELRGVSFFESIVNKVKEGESLKTQLRKSQIRDIGTTVRKIRDVDRMLFDFAFPNNNKTVELEFKLLQNIIKNFLLRIFTIAATADNLVDENGLIIPELEFDNIDLENDQDYHNNVAYMRDYLGIDKTVSPQEYINSL